MAKAKIATAKDIELNCWCIEMAMRWPVVSIYGYGNGAAALGAYQPNVQRQDQDADVIGRAGKIMAWVKASHSTAR